MITYELTVTKSRTIEAESEDQALEEFYELEHNNMDDLYPDIKIKEIK